MSRRELADNSVRKLIRHGGSLYVSLPKEELTKLKWRAKQKVVVKRVGERFVIEDWK